MAKIVSIRKPVLLPFPETRLRAGQSTVIQSAAARGTVLVSGIMVADEPRSLTRIQVQDTDKRPLTSGEFVAAELVERLPLVEHLNETQQFEIVVMASKDCLFVGALRCVQLFYE